MNFLEAFILKGRYDGAMRYVLNDLTIDTKARNVRRGDITLKLPDLSYDVLLALVKMAPDPLGSAEISQQAWGTDHVTNETISQRITLLRKSLDDDPKEPRYIRTVRGKGYAIAGQIAWAEEPSRGTFDWLAKPKPRAMMTAGVAVLAGAAFLLLSFPKSALESTGALAQSAQSTASQTLLQRARQQLSLHQSLETDRAIAMLREALAKDPDSFDARLTMSFALSTRATKFGGDEPDEQEAETIARALISERPGNSNAWSALAYSLGSQGRMDESLPAYRRAHQLDPANTAALSSAAHVLLLRGELHQALLLEMKAKQAGGNSRYAEIQIAQIMELIDHPSVSHWRERALALNPGQVVVLGEIARSHLRDGNPESALETLDQADGQDRVAPQILQLRGRANISLGRIAVARQILGEAGWRGEYDLAALDALSGDDDRANAIFNPVKLADIESDPDPQSRVQLAEIRSAQGKQDQALRLLSQAVSLGWRDARWLEHSPFLGELLASEGGKAIGDRIEREIEAQRMLIAATVPLTEFLARR
ncbi:MAG: winged helix-turn-helix domain-containing protein [Erythrobacter sp.]|uniref:winged helix-turn-helix domain-containing protein n=1 Tax=Erythrobacter sp. TaxID=1042 RepID=UPI0032995BDC